MNKSFAHKGHQIEIVNDRSRHALIYMVLIDDKYVQDLNRPINECVEWAKAIVNKLESGNDIYIPSV